jgi:hypothetical protein
MRRNHRSQNSLRLLGFGPWRSFIVRANLSKCRAADAKLERAPYPWSASKSRQQREALGYDT